MSAKSITFDAMSDERDQTSLRRRLLRENTLQYLANVAVLIGAMLSAAQMRLQLPYGKALGLLFLFPTRPGDPAMLGLPSSSVFGQTYVALRLEFYAVFGLITLLVQAIVWGASQTQPLSRWTPAQRQSAAVLVSGALSAFVLHRQWVDLSGLQLVYFALGCLGLSLLTILWPGSLYAQHENHSLAVNLRKLWDNRVLLNIWVQYNVRSRYSQTILGILWIILLPLSTSLVLALVFSEFFQAHVGNLPFVVFLLAGIVPWGLFNYGAMTGTRSVLSAMGLINQIYFPREILIFVTLGEGLVDLSFTFLAMLVINALNGFAPNVYFIYLPIVLMIQILLTLGVMLFVSSLSVFIRDVPQLVAVALQLLFYLTPILYPAENVPARYRLLTLINPLAPLIKAYRDIILKGTVPSFTTLYYPAVVSIAVVYAGYAFFKTREDRFADLL